MKERLYNGENENDDEHDYKTNYQVLQDDEQDSPKIKNRKV